MTIEVHTVQEPAWIRVLVEDVVLPSVTPLGFMGPLRYCYWEPGSGDNPFAGWQLVVFPTPGEVAGPSPNDGCRFVNGFRLDVLRILSNLTEVESVVWNAPVQYNGHLDGPEIEVQAKFVGNPILFRFFNVPPPDEPSSYLLNPATGEAKMV